MKSATGRPHASASAVRRRAAATAAAAALLLGACAPKVKPYAAPALADKHRMAILPFENLTKATGAAKTLEGMVLVEFLKRAPVTIVDPGEVAAALSKARVRIATSMSRDTLAAVARELGVDLVLVGTLHDYDVQTGSGAGTSGPIPVLAMTLRVVDARGGNIVWAANAARRGTDRETVFGIGRVHSLNALAEEAAASMAEAFAASLRSVRRGGAAPPSARPADVTPPHAAPASAAPDRAASDKAEPPIAAESAAPPPRTPEPPPAGDAGPARPADEQQTPAAPAGEDAPDARSEDARR